MRSDLLMEVLRIPTCFNLVRQEIERTGFKDTYCHGNRTVCVYYTEALLIRGISYLQDGMLHRETEDGPAHMQWHTNGRRCTTAYFIGGELHRPPKEGFAFQEWGQDGLTLSASYYLYGTHIKTSEI